MSARPLRVRLTAAVKQALAPRALRFGRCSACCAPAPARPRGGPHLPSRPRRRGRRPDLVAPGHRRPPPDVRAPPGARCAATSRCCRSPTSPNASNRDGPSSGRRASSRSTTAGSTPTRRPGRRCARIGVPAIGLPAGATSSARDACSGRSRAAALLASIADRARRDAAFATRARAALAPHGLDGLLGLSGPAAAPGHRRRHAGRASTTTRGQQRSPLPALLELASESADAVDAVDAFMTWAQVREMAQAGITFGGHGATHRLLDTLPPAEAEAEVRASRARAGTRAARPRHRLLLSERQLEPGGGGGGRGRTASASPSPPSAAWPDRTASASRSDASTCTRT